VRKTLGVLIDFLKFWGFEIFRGAFSPIFGGPPQNFLLVKGHFQLVSNSVKTKGLPPPIWGNRPLFEIFLIPNFTKSACQQFLCLCTLTTISILYAKEKKNWGSFDAFRRYRGLNLKILWVSITPNFLPRGGTNRKYFLSVENTKRIYIKHPLYTMALYVFVSELPGGRTFDFFCENFWLRSFAFLTNFRRIDFPISFIIDAHWRVLSKFEVKFRIWWPVFEIRGTKKISDPPNIYPNFRFSASKFSFLKETREIPKPAKFRRPIPNRESQGARQIFEFFG